MSCESFENRELRFELWSDKHAICYETEVGSFYMKIAACFSTPSVNCLAAIEKMTESMRLTEDQVAGSFIVSGGAIGYVLGTDRFSKIPLQ